MPLLDDNVRQQVREGLGDLPNPVRLVMFSQEFECQFCRETRQLVEEVASIHDQIEHKVYNLITDKEKAEELGIDKIPAIAVIGEKDYGIRFYGIPSGYEFSSLIESIKLASSGTPHLSPAGLEFIESINEPVHIQVFVTPT